MKRFTSYKDSELEWIGDIPEHWGIGKFNLLVKIRHGHQFMNHDFTDSGVKIVKITQLHKDGYLDISDCSFIASSRLEEFKSIIIKEKDILMCLTGGTIGKIIRVEKVDEPLLQNYRVGHFSSADRAIMDDSFIFWVMSSDSLIAQIFFQMRETGQPNIGMGDFGKMKITIPPLSEQTQIAQYLDHKTSQIDKLITDKEKLIELLNEERTTIINQAVTKGLNPDTSMKDSGIEWLGEVPEHWEVWKLSHAFQKVGGGTTPESGNPLYHENGTINWLNTGDLNDGILYQTSKKITSKSLADYTSLKVFPADSVVIAMYGATIGKTSLVKCEITTNQACCVFQGSEVIENEFLFYWFIANKMNIINLSKGGGQPNISQEILKSLKVPCPEKNEQIRIVNFIESEVAKNEMIVRKIQEEIELLKEYKTALISEVVTGKVDVRDEVIAESTELVS